jgi:hypothetical protein
MSGLPKQKVQVHGTQTEEKPHHKVLIGVSKKMLV